MNDPRFASQYQRLKHRQELDQHISRWTSSRTKQDITELLQTHGVAATPVMNAEERLFDPHYRERGLYQDIEHPSLGAEPIFNLMWKLSTTPPAIGRHAPLLGEHNQEVFCGILGMSEEEVQRLEASQVIW
jgi:crotonobetainyl-CoA:carnitine CoA-transferase CaiB-like acyl-CoA transferase